MKMSHLTVDGVWPTKGEHHAIASGQQVVFDKKYKLKISLLLVQPFSELHYRRDKDSRPVAVATMEHVVSTLWCTATIWTAVHNITVDVVHHMVAATEARNLLRYPD